MSLGHRLPAAMAVFAAMASPAFAATITVRIENLAFVPAKVEAKVGDTIEWVNKDPFTHTATVDKAWEVVVEPNAAGHTVLRQAGSVEYYCRYHPNMTGRILVSPP